MLRFAARLVRPCWKWLVVVAVAMLVETALRLAAPWPPKVVLDPVLGGEPLPAALAWLAGSATDRLAICHGTISG